ARICAAHADRADGVRSAVVAYPGTLTCPLAPTTGSGTPGIPCCRTHVTAARAAARLPSEALCCVCVPLPRLGPGGRFADAPHAASAITASAMSGIRRNERFIGFLSGFVR